MKTEKKPDWIQIKCGCGKESNYLPTVSGTTPCDGNGCHKLLTVPKIVVNKETHGVTKLKKAMEEYGYKKVSEMTGCSQSLLFQYCNGSRDPIGMRLKTAMRLYRKFNINFMDWE